MPVIPATSAVPHEIPGARFVSYVAPSTGSAALCAWRVEIPARTVGAPHRPLCEEVLAVLTGPVTVHLDGVATEAHPGDVVLVPAGATFHLDNPRDEPATAWVSTTVGFEAEMADGTRFTPPWVQ